MVATDYDVIIGGYKAKIDWEQEGAFKRRTVRREIEQQVVTQGQNAQLQSRADGIALLQDSWAGGATWWKPRLTPDTISTYFRANHLDLWSEPGKAVPLNSVTAAAVTTLHDYTCIATGPLGTIYAIGSTNTTNASYLDVYKWTPGSGAFVRETAYHSGIAAAKNPRCMVYDENDGYFYALTNGNKLVRFNPTTNAVDAAWISVTCYRGSNIFVHNQALMLYTGDKIYTVNKSAPSVTSVADDGLGPEPLRIMDIGGTKDIVTPSQLTLAVPTPQGIYYVKNARVQGQYQPMVYRVDKNDAGSYIVNPIAPLDIGSLALSCQWHLGQLIISTSPDPVIVFANDGSTEGYFEVVLYYVGDGGAGALGSVLGGRSVLEDTSYKESPFMLLGSVGTNLYFAGARALWLYDGIRGGIHHVMDFASIPTAGAYGAMAQVLNASGDKVLALFAKDLLELLRISGAGPDTVTAFGDDETYYTLESNFFDANLPMEQKELTKVAILRDAGDGDQEWTIQVAADDGSFSDVLVDAGTSVYAEAETSGTSGYQFRYKAIYQTKDTMRSALKAVMLTFATGEMVTEWDMILDGDELLNVNNEVQDEQQFYDDMVTLGSTKTITTLVDNVQEQAQETAVASTQNVKVMAVETVKSKPGESKVRIVLRED